ncbi:ABC-three component system middle component 6 [Domibacillus iocasae]|uniref:ABC-three component system middle component 6 n=1 Tax=Domibacillus iocasae TaxID=1714016 RepID=UPI00085940B1|nr:ABC-three component system middle component 6 [Domibacillus iocasae]
MLIDKDSKPKDTILYLSAQLLATLKKHGQVKLALIEELYEEIDEKQPLFKYNLALNFLFLINKVKIEGGDLVYVPK